MCSIGYRRVAGTAAAAYNFETVDGRRLPVPANTHDPTRQYSHWSSDMWVNSRWDNAGSDCSFLDFNYIFGRWEGDIDNTNSWKTWNTTAYKNGETSPSAAQFTGERAAGWSIHTCTYSPAGGAMCKIPSSIYTCSPPPSPPPPPPRPPSPPSPPIESCEQLRTAAAQHLQ